MATALTVALIGGESSGKTALGVELQRRLRGLGVAAALVSEHLREWCEATGRAPTAGEQAAIATEQSRRIEAAARAPGTAVVIADTTALMVAAYSELYFQDTSLLAAALEAQRSYGLTLLMGLDIPWRPDGLFRDSPRIREATDALLRRSLQAGGIRFETIYGTTLEARTRQALRAIGRALGQPLVDTDPALSHGRRPWSCEHCSDPDCEHRLFTGLLPPRA